MHQYAAGVPAWDVLEVGDVFDGGLKTLLFSLRTAEDEVC